MAADDEFPLIKDCSICVNIVGPGTVGCNAHHMWRVDNTDPASTSLGLVTGRKLVDQFHRGLKKYCPDAIIVSIANPLDAIVYRLYQQLNPAKNKLMGMAGALDSSRYRYFVAQAAGVSVDNVEALVLGGHGDTMVPVRSCCRIGGMPVEKFVDNETLNAIEDRTRKAGGEVVKLLGVGSAFVSPAWAALEMVDAIAYDRKKIMPVCAKLEGEYGVKDLFLGVPAILGKTGMEKVIEADLTADEKAALEHSVGAVRKTCDEVENLSK